MNEYSLAAYLNLDEIHKSEWYQKLLGVLSVQPMSREQLYETFPHPKRWENPALTYENTINPRISELKKKGIVVVVGEGRTESNSRCEILGLNHELLR